jgi:hypothetical protein
MARAEKDTLFIVNLSSQPLDLSLLTIQGEKGSFRVASGAWLEIGECLHLRKAEGRDRESVEPPTDLACTNLVRLSYSVDHEPWKDDFWVFFNAVEVGYCEKGKGRERENSRCTVVFYY